MKTNQDFNYRCAEHYDTDKPKFADTNTSISKLPPYHRLTKESVTDYYLFRKQTRYQLLLKKKTYTHNQPKTA